MRVLIACEFSATVRDAFRARGHDAWSCDLLPCEGDPAWHIQGDALATAHGSQWDLMIAHPPCTHLAVSGARWFKDKREEQAQALAFVRALLAAPIPRIALENPVSIISSHIRKPDWIIQPWQFGHGETKKTCLWLKGLPPLWPTNIVDGREARIHKMPPGPNRWRERSRTYYGIAEPLARAQPHILRHRRRDGRPMGEPMITTTVHDDRTRSVAYYGRLLGHYGPVRYKRTHARAWRCVTVLGALGYARNEADARRWLMEMVP